MSNEQNPDPLQSDSYDATSPDQAGSAGEAMSAAAAFPKKPGKTIRDLRAEGYPILKALRLQAEADVVYCRERQVEVRTIDFGHPDLNEKAHGIADQGVADSMDRVRSLNAILSIRMGDRPNVQYIRDAMRPDSLFGMAKWIRRHVGAADADVIECCLALTNHRWCQPPLPADDVAAIAKRVFEGVQFDPTDSTGDDVAAGKLFADFFGWMLHWDEKRQDWFLWGTHFWIPGPAGGHRLAQGVAKHLKTLALSFPLEMKTIQGKDVSLNESSAAKWMEEWSHDLGSSGSIGKMKTEAKPVKPMHDDGEGWDETPWLLACKNGIVDLKTGARRDGLPTDRISRTTRIDFDPEAKALRWEEFLLQIFPTGAGKDKEGNTTSVWTPKQQAEAIEWLQRALGYSLTANPTEHRWFAMKGGGRNGKGTLLRALSATLGQYVHVATLRPLTLGGGDERRKKNDLAHFQGRRLIYVNESCDNAHWDPDMMKTLSGGDWINAHFPYGRNIEFPPTFSLWFGLNELPETKATDVAFWDRVTIIPFYRYFGDTERDRKLDEKLHAEREGILAWLVRGAVSYWEHAKDGESGLLPLPDGIKKATEEYQKESDPLAAFFIEDCRIAPDAAPTRSSAISDAYFRYCQRKNVPLSARVSAKKVGMLLAKRFKGESRRDGQYYFGIELLPHARMRPGAKRKGRG